MELSTGRIFPIPDGGIVPPDCVELSKLPDTRCAICGGTGVKLWRIVKEPGRRGEFRRRAVPCPCTKPKLP